MVKASIVRTLSGQMIFVGNGNNERGLKGGLPFLFRQVMVNTKGAACSVSVAGVSPAYTARQMSHIYDEYGAAVQGKAYTAARVEEKTKEDDEVKHAKARAYLQKIKDFEARINGKKVLLQELTSKLLDVSSAGFSDERVSGGLAKGFADTIIKKIELENEINADIIKFVGLKNDITNTIYKLNNPVYISILFKKYVEGKDFEEIVDEVHYEPGYVYNMHGRALAAFDKICEEM